MGSVPNCRKEIADHYPIRWFKCKLKPPKNAGRIGPNVRARQESYQFPFSFHQTDVKGSQT